MAEALRRCFHFNYLCVGFYVRWKYFPVITPKLGADSRYGREYGVALAWNF